MDTAAFFWMAHLLSEELGCCARYSDGKTPIQWISESYNVV
jgi:hypothetical protein